MLVVDASVAIAWTLADEGGTSAENILTRVLADGAMAPVVWNWEVQSALRAAERRRRITVAESTEAAAALRALPVELCAPAELGRDLTIAREYGLSVYDASYIELATRKKLELATLDGALSKVARDLQILAKGL